MEFESKGTPEFDNIQNPLLVLSALGGQSTTPHSAESDAHPNMKLSRDNEFNTLPDTIAPLLS